MKKLSRILLLTGLSLLLFGCSENMNLDLEQPIDDVNAMHKDIQDANSLSPDMKQAVFAIAHNNSEFYNFMNQQDIKTLPKMDSKNEVITQIAEYQDNINSWKIYSLSINDVDREFEDVIYNYQYNADKVIAYTIKYIQSGSADDLKMSKSYIDDLRPYSEKLDRLGEKYNLN